MAVGSWPHTSFMNRILSKKPKAHSAVLGIHPESLGETVDVTVPLTTLTGLS